MQVQVKCCDCRCVDEKEEICKLTGHKINIQSSRNCKRFGSKEKKA